MQVMIYRNLTTGKLSIKDLKTKKVLGYCDNIELLQADFKVSEKTRQRVIKERKKYVHATVNGTVNSLVNFIPRLQNKCSLQNKLIRLSTNEDQLSLNFNQYEIIYNPFTFNQFRLVGEFTPVFKAGAVSINKNGKMLGVNLRHVND